MRGEPGAWTLPRRLTDIEASFAYTHALAKGTSQVTTLVTVSGEPDEQRVESAVARWAGELPVLALRITERPEGLWFTSGPAFLPEQLRQRELLAGETPDELLRRELNQLLPTGGPLWRLRAVRDPGSGCTHLLFTRNHAISDGHSTGAVVRALLDALFGRSGPPSPFRVRELPVAPPEVIDHQTGSPMASRLPFARQASWSQRSADLLTVPLTRTEGVALRSWCKRQGVTVNQFFGAAFVQAYGEATGRTVLELATAVSTRRRHRVPDVGCYIGVLGVPVRTDGELVLRAREYGAALVRAGAGWQPPAREHARIRQAVEQVAAARTAGPICLTNVGPVDQALGPHAARVTGYRTVVNRTAANYGLVLHLGGYAGGFAATLAFGTPATDPALVAEVAKGLHDRVVRPGPG
ncbi:hypothetical protein ACFYNO_31460 [Kitasatospora sp. NPDC006697]|uniref:hypothetical protein n=1 Tax=Kitasatospora sp. NPDC006697 TaxID=3364020 RepID=UPI00368F3781